MTRLAWLTDIHLDHLKPRPEVRQAFAEMVAEDSDCCCISGDISTWHDARLIGDFASRYDKPVYFVLGNHDIWGGSFGSARTQIKVLQKTHANLHWLTHSDPIDIAPGVQLCGVDGWYDAQFGSWKDSSFEMVDWNAIYDFWGMRKDGIVQFSRERASDQAVIADIQLEKTTAKRVIFVTHVPPYEQAAQHQGQPSSRISLPWYTNRILGLVLDKWAKANPERDLTTLCGHTHSGAEFQRADNHIVLAGAAEYGAPRVQKVFEL